MRERERERERKQDYEQEKKQKNKASRTPKRTSPFRKQATSITHTDINCFITPKQIPEETASSWRYSLVIRLTSTPACVYGNHGQHQWSWWALTPPTTPVIYVNNEQNGTNHHTPRDTTHSFHIKSSSVATARERWKEVSLFLSFSFCLFFSLSSFLSFCLSLFPSLSQTISSSLFPGTIQATLQHSNNLIPSNLSLIAWFRHARPNSTQPNLT